MKRTQPKPSPICVKNVSRQGLELIFNKGGQWEHYWLEAGKSVSVPQSHLTDTVRTLAARKLIEVK